MTPSQFSGILASYSTLLLTAGNREESVEIDQLAFCMSNLGAATWVALRKRVKANLKANFGASAEIPNTQASLGGLVEQLVAAVALLNACKSPAAKDFAALAEIAGNAHDVPLDQLERLFSSPEIKTGPAGHRGPVNSELAQIDLARRVKESAELLTKANLDPAAFRVTLANLRAAKFKKTEICEIANRFLGTNRKFQSIGKALEEIEIRHRQDLLGESSGRIIERIAS